MDVLISLVDSRFSVLKTDLTETSVELCQHHRGGGGELEGMEFENGGAKELENGSCDPQKNGMHWHRTTFQRDLVTPSNLSSLCLALWVRCLRSRLCVFGVLSSRCNSWKRRHFREATVYCRQMCCEKCRERELDKCSTRLGSLLLIHMLHETFCGFHGGLRSGPVGAQRRPCGVLT